MVNQRQKQFGWQALVAMFFILLVATLYLSASPLFKGNPWVDSNAMLTIGQAWQQGVIPYRDIFEQRGPVMFFYYYCANLISASGYIGLFVFEVLNLIGIWFWGVKILSLLTVKHPLNVWAALILPVGLLANYSFEHGGSPEELSLFWVLGGFYILLKYLQKQELSVYGSAFVGFSAAAVFWIKYSLLGPFIAFTIIVAVRFIWQKQWAHLVKTILAFLLGFGLLTGVIIAYFSSQQALAALFHVYFTVNLSAYAAGGEHHSFLAHVLGTVRPMAVGFIVHPIISLAFLGSLIRAYLKRQRQLLVLSVVTTAITAFVAYWSLLRYPYVYLIVIGSMLPIIAWALADFLGQIKGRRLLFGTYLTAAALLVLSPWLGNIVTHTNVLKGSKTNYPAKAFGEYINQHQQGKPASLVYANFIDMGVGRYTKLSHHNYFFEQSNFTKEAFPEQNNYVTHLIKEQKPDYLVFDLNITNLKQVDLSDQAAVEKKIDPTILKHYQVVKSGSTRTIGAVYVTGPRKLDQVQYVLMSRKES